MLKYKQDCKKLDLKKIKKTPQNVFIVSERKHKELKINKLDRESGLGLFRGIKLEAIYRILKIELVTSLPIS